MSMLKTLKSNPGTISLFKSSTVIHSLLKKNAVKQSQVQPMKKSLWGKIVNGSKEFNEIENYIIQEETDNPTWDEVKLIKSYTETLRNNNNTNNTNNNNNNNNNNAQIFKKVFPLFVYDNKIVISEVLYKSVAKQDWFKPPLVVDWEKSIIANDLKSVKELLKSYD